MLRSLYSGVSGMRGFQSKLDVIGNNIANVNTTGFKSGRVMFQDILSQTTAGISAPDAVRGGVNAKQVGLGVATASIDTIHTQGSAMTTNVVTDLRVNGDGFFAVAPIGQEATPYLTRAGNFLIDSNRNLVNAEGLHVIGVGGAAIVLDPAVTSFTIAQNGQIIAVNQDGTNTPTGQVIAIQMVTNPGGLEKVGGNLYRMTPNANTGAAYTESTPGDITTGAGTIISGQLEMSNVDLTGEFTEMIIAQRGFQANSKIITTSDQILQEIIAMKQ